MASRIDVLSKVADTGYRRLVLSYLMEEAKTVYTEGAVTGHAERLAYAPNIFTETFSVSAIMYSVLSNAAIMTKLMNDQNPTVAEIQTAVIETFNAFAGVES